MKKQNKAVFLIHGYATDIDDFIPLLPFLKEHYDHIELKNLPGHGNDSNIVDFNAIDTIKMVDEQAKTLFKNYRKVDLIGFSMGGAISTYLSSQFKFNKVVLLSPANKFLNFNLGFSRVKLFFEYFDSILTHKEIAVNNGVSLSQIRKDMLANDKLSYKLAFSKVFPRYTPHSISAFKDVVNYANEKLEKNKINNKTLILWGDVDQLVPFKSIKHIAAKSNKAKVEVLVGISHLMLHSKNCEIIIEKISNFLLGK